MNLFLYFLEIFYLLYLFWNIWINGRGADPIQTVLDIKIQTETQ